MRLCALHFSRYVFIVMCLISVLRVFLGVLRKDVDFLKRYIRYYNEIKWWEVLWKNFEKICSGIEFILLYTWKCIEIIGYLDFYQTFCKNDDFLTCRGCNLNEFLRILNGMRFLRHY